LNFKALNIVDTINYGIDMTTTNTRQEISLSQLKPGMYVVEIIRQKDSLQVKSEGYIVHNSTIDKLASSGIHKVIVDPSKEKKADKIDRVLPVEPPKQQTSLPKESTISFDDEMSKAKTLYKDAKSLQHKILADITEGKVINVGEVKQSTDAMVESIFRNQDALSCMSRLRIKDEYLVEHSLNVSILMTIFAKHLNIEKRIIEQLALGAFLHDIGKTLVPDHILNKKGKFTDKEYQQMKEHVDLGVNILAEIPELSAIALNIVQQHHERIDGSGYPKQLSSDDLNQYARMIAIVDTYDAMTADRVYKAAMHPIKAFKILLKEAETGYDDELVELFIQCIGVYPVGTLVKLNSGKLGLISQLNESRPLRPFVRVFYNTRLNQAIPMAELDLSQSKHKDQIDCCIKPEDFKLDLLKFFQQAFWN